MLTKTFLVVVIFLCLQVEADLSVDQYNDLINNFISGTNSYIYPSDSKSYLQGSQEPQECIKAGSYDFVIVGGGSAGTVLANRLSEINYWNVLLIEAGGEENEITDIPAMFDYLRLSDFNWGYKSVPQKNSLFGYLNNSEIIPRGKVLGGSSTINAIMYSRGNKADYNLWAEIGNPGWSYKEVLPYFKKSENANISLEDRCYHGHKGGLNVQNADILSPLTEAFLSATKELGKEILDYNGKDEMGFSRLQLTSVEGKRNSGAKAFINPARNRTNLDIATNALALEILMDGPKATGIRFIQNGKTYCVYADKEVILSAGAINTPQLLMISGIGPRRHLNEKGITVIKDLPVGENLWDHICYAFQPFTTNIVQDDKTQTELIQEYLQGRGEYTSSDAVQDIGFESLYWSNKLVPDIELILRTSKVPTFPYEYYKMTKNIDENVYNSIIKPTEGTTTWNTYAVLLNPASRGTVKLKTKSPYDFPLIDPNYFSDKNNSDLNTFVAAIRDMINISNTNAMQKYNSRILYIDLPGCRQFVNGSDPYYRCLVQHLASTLHHYSGTCKMGPATDKAAVVSPELKVWGIENLRVADTSVIPVTISGHTNAVAFMIGEKASDLIKKSWLVMWRQRLHLPKIDNAKI